MITRPDWIEMAQAMAREGKSVEHIHRTLDRWFQACLLAGEANDNDHPRLNKEQTK
jgi:hypothetical protein